MTKTENKCIIQLRQKAGLIVFSILVTVIFLEIALRLGGFIHLSIQEQKNKTAFRRRDSYRILCIGESTTYLDGKHEYPDFLNEILNSTYMELNNLFLILIFLIFAL